MISHQIEIRLCTTDSDGTGFTSAPTKVKAASELDMNARAVEAVRALGLLQYYGVIDSYTVRLDCEGDEDAPGAGP